MLDFSSLKFDLADICVGSSIAIVGPRGSGKTELIKDIMKYMDYLENRTIFCCDDPKSTFNIFCSNSRLKARIYAYSRLKYSHKILQNEFVNNNSLIIFDDMGGHKHEISQLDTISNATRIFSMQYITKSECSNYDYIFVFPCPNVTQYSRMYSNYDHLLLKRNFNPVMKITQRLPFTTTVIVNRYTMNEKKNYGFFWYKVDHKSRDDFLKPELVIDILPYQTYTSKSKYKSEPELKFETETETESEETESESDSDSDIDKILVESERNNKIMNEMILLKYEIKRLIESLDQMTKSIESCNR